MLLRRVIACTNFSRSVEAVRPRASLQPRARPDCMRLASGVQENPAAVVNIDSSTEVARGRSPWMRSWVGVLCTRGSRALLRQRYADARIAGKLPRSAD